MRISFKYLSLQKKHCLSCLNLEGEKKFFDMLRMFEQFETLEEIVKYWNNWNFKVDYPDLKRLKILEDIHPFKTYFHFHGAWLNRFFWGVDWDTLYVMYIDPKWEIDKKSH